MTSFTNTPEMAQMLSDFEDRWKEMCWEFRVKFLTEAPEKTIPVELLRPITKAEFSNMVSLIRGVKRCNIDERMGGGVTFHVWIHPAYYHSKILVRTIEEDCKRIIRKFKPITLQFHINFIREDEMYRMNVLREHMAQFRKSFNAIHDALFPLEKALRNAAGAMGRFSEEMNNVNPK